MAIMAKNTIKSIRECPVTLDELLEAIQDPSGKYHHLQIILKRNNNNRSLELGQKYLVVNSSGFGVYQLLDINYSNGIIQLKLKNTNTDKIVHTSLNINDKHP
jgi:Cys-tRNA synthase (O-phospho-L-seryl-tRNA:Cys-tRNA synthase)